MPCCVAYAISASRVMAQSRTGASVTRSGRQRGGRDLEAHLVVALAGAAVRDRVGAVLARDLHLLAAISGRERADTSG